MSHRWDCPTEWEAEHEGRRAGQRGRSRYGNPYADIPGNDHCPEAERAWDRGHRRGELAREEEEQEERAARRRAEAQRIAAEEEEAYYAAQQEREYYAGMESEHYAELERAQIAEMEAQYAEEQDYLERMEYAFVLMAEEALR